MAKSITFTKEKFIKKFLRPISQISDAATIEITKELALCCTYSSDKSKQTLILYTTFVGLESDSEEPIKLNLASVNRLIQFINVIPDDKVTLLIDGQSLHYKSNGFNFKYYLMESSALPKEIMSKESILNVQYNFEFNMTKEKLREISKLSAIVASKMPDSESAKIYFYTKGTEVYGELNDKTIPNLDAAEVCLSEAFTGKSITMPIPISFSVFKLLQAIDSDFLNIRINVEKGILSFSVNDSDSKQLYLTSARVK